MRVLMVTDVRVYRDQLTSTLGGDDRIEVAGAATCAADAIQRVGEFEPEVALLDARMPGAFTAARTIAEAFPETCVLALGLGETAEDVFAWAAAGIGGWVGCDSSFEDLVARVERASAGEFVCTAKIASGLLRQAAMMSRQEEHRKPERMTPRELEVLELLHEGLSNKEIASQLHITVSTVKNHVHHLLAKLGAHSRGEAVSTGRRLGLLPTTARAGARSAAWDGPG